MFNIPPHEIHESSQRRHVGKQVWRFPRLESTNTLALALAVDATHDGLVLLAAEQSAGRGQYGRTWTAPPGSGVLLTTILFPPAHARRPAVLTALAAVSVCATIEKMIGLETRIKWPNDVLLLEHKVCGILIEQRNTGLREHPLAVAVGVGLNVTQTEDFFAQANLPLAGSLQSLAGQKLDTNRVAEQLIEQLDVAYCRLLGSDIETLEESWARYLNINQKQVTVELANGKIEGRVAEMTWDGVLLEGTDGLELIAPESIRHIYTADRLCKP